MLKKNSDILQEKADQGDIESLCKLALCYETGVYGVPDIPKAYELWLKAANQGSGWALYKVGDLIKNNLVEGSEADANDYFLKANAAGYKTAKDKLAVSSTSSASVSAMNGKKILLVDDEPEVAKIQKIVFEQSGYQLIHAINGREGLKKLSENPDIAVIFCDLIMPEMNGFQFIQTLRNIDAASGVPIFIVSGMTKPEYIAKGKQLKVTGWIAKPFPSDLLLTMTNKTAK